MVMVGNLVVDDDKNKNDRLPWRVTTHDGMVIWQAGGSASLKFVTGQKGGAAAATATLRGPRPGAMRRDQVQRHAGRCGHDGLSHGRPLVIPGLEDSPN